MIFTVIIKFLIENMIFIFGYISNGNLFPEPLSAKEEEMYFKLYKNGDEDAKKILIERNLRLVVHVSKKYAMSGKDSDDLISIGSIGLIKAVSTYDVEKGHKFATYAARCIQNEILMYLRSSKKLQNEVSIDDSIGSDKEGNTISLIDILENDEPAVVDKVDLRIKTSDLYDKMKACLTDRERLIIVLRYGLSDKGEKTQKEVADMLDISRSYVSRIEKKAIEKLKDKKLV